MAKIILSMKEAVALAKRSGRLQEKIKDITAENSKFKVTIPNPVPFLPEINVDITYTKFENEKIYFAFAGNMMVAPLGNLIKFMEPKGITIDYPDLIIDINELTPQEYEDIIVTDVQFDGDEFTIETKIIEIPNI
jgi:hypothetical protein